MVNNPGPDHKDGLKCPQCTKSRFKTLLALRDHFLALHHPIKCNKCSKEFQDVMPLIDHYQKHNKKKAAPSTPPVKEAKKQNQNLSSTKPKSSQQNISPKTTEQAALQIPKVTSLPLPTSPEFPPPSISTQVPPSATLDTNLYLTQKIIFEDLRSQCHPPGRLEREGYFLGFPSLIQNNRVRRGTMGFYEFLPSPKLKFPTTKRLAIVVDCEMVEVGGNNEEVIFLSAVDFFTGEILINNLVKPTDKVKDWRTKVSGASPALMNSACAAGEVIGGWQAARQQLWELMDEHTVLIGHSLQNDLEVLGMLHYNIVDSSILISEAVFPPSTPTQRLKRKWALKTLAKEFLNREIQVEKSGHSALEDAFATRDVVFWCMCNPQLLLLWAEQQRVQEQVRIQSAKEKQSLERKKEKETPKPLVQYEGLDEEQDYLSSDIEYWSETAEDCGYSLVF